MPRSSLASSAFALLLPVAAVCAADKDPFQELVRPTEPLTPQQERAAFHLPPGFEIQLVASEPDLRKPMNLQWDALGRLWITESREYPFPVKDGSPGRDTVRIFSDFGPDGRARKVEIFADGLNIPTGLYPFRSPDAAGKVTWKCIVWSIPNIWLMEDTDGDGKADKREVLFGPLGWERDTHGNLSSFRRGADGWLYGTHGFNNESTMRGRDGSELHLQSGNTWRVRLDGSRVEGNTWGQVNPFGLCWDDRGNLYSADCHSSPIYQLLRGAFYPSFGKPHDGLGFAPQTITHSHGSTAICAPIYISDPAWPAEFQNHMFVGNVQTSRLNQDAITFHGSSSKGQELPDFLSTDDPWFRPVDQSWGPDGALYVADFYNKIIGHYEVPLTHPGRDRERGRLWRIVYRGKDGALPKPELPADVAGLVKELGSGNPTRRTLALNELCDRIRGEAVAPLRTAIAKPLNGLQKANALWALFRLGEFTDALLLSALADGDPLVRTHAAKLSRELPKWAPPVADAVRAATRDADAFVRRNAAEALGAHADAANVPALGALLRSAPKDDDHLIHAARIALRDQLRNADVLGSLVLDKQSADERAQALEMLLAVPGEAAADFRLKYFAEHADASPLLLAQHLPTIARNLAVPRFDALLALVQQRLGDNPAQLANAIDGLLSALEQRGLAPDAALRSWGPQVVTALLTAGENTQTWTNSPLEGAPPSASPWAFEERNCADGTKGPFLSSLPRGEALTGLLRSAPFALPGTLSFSLCGHDGEPGQPPGKKNFVRLRDVADGQVLREAAPPRNDVAKRVSWPLEEFKGHTATLEITDGDTGKAYAWLAVARFEPALPQLALVEPQQMSRRLQTAANLVRTLHLDGFEPALSKIAFAPAADPEARAAAARALVSANRETAGPQLAGVIGDPNAPAAVREKFAIALAEARSPTANAAIAAALRDAPHRLQQAFAAALASSPEGADVLLTACADGKAPAALLRDKALVDRLKAAKFPDLEARLTTLTANLPPANAELDKLIATRRATFDPAKASAVRGADVYARNCAVCHTIEGKGGMVGPQLDGIGGRGPDRLLEDILDPNRNVDRAFRMTVVTLKNGSVVSGLYRREEGAQLVLADLAAQESRVPAGDIASRKETETSLMPPTFSELVSEADMNDLLAFLLSKRVPK
jgi:putative heme-binding domain-containing protein